MTAESVREAYRVFLRREPESDEVVRVMSANLLTDYEIDRHFLVSSEFNKKYGYFLNLPYATLGRVETTCPEGRMQALLTHVAQQWHAMGEAEPYWSVCTHPGYRGPNADLDSFWASGRDLLDHLDSAVARSNVPMRTGIILELGCGVGRSTPFLLTAFDHVVAVDVSRSHLGLFLQRMSEDLDRITSVLLTSVSDLEVLGQVDVVVSRFVLQHNPPPVQRELVSVMVSLLRPGGLMFVQVPVAAGGYSFVVDEYLAHPPSGLEMHCLPVRDFFVAVQEAGGEVIDAVLDVGSTGGWGVPVAFLVRKNSDVT